MKTLPQFLCLLAALTLATGPSLRAQYNPPPPPEQQAPSDQDQQAPPPDDQQPPMGQDQQAPPPDDEQAPPPDDQGAPQDEAAGDASGNANFQTFYNDLSSEGTWVQTDNYGYAWQPNVQDPDWAPYQNGHWVYTEEGWTWVADDSEPWGWATYHYGRWVNIDGEGWVWVPGYTWAPAWVSWRYGGGYCGWAPLPPDTFLGIDVGGYGPDFLFHIGGDCDTAYGIGPGYYNFLPVGDLGARNYRGYYRNRNDNFAIIANTRNVTSINVSNQRGSGRFGRVTVGGPSFATVNAQSHTPVQRAELSRSSRVGDASLSGNRLAVYAPRVNAAGAGATYRPHSVGRTLSNVQVNRGTNIKQPLAVNSRLRPAAASSQQIQAAHTAQAHLAKGSDVALAGARPTHELSRPLTSYKPHNAARTSTASHTSTAATKTRTQARTSTSTADRAFTGGETENRMSESAARRAANSAAAKNHATTEETQAHANVHAETNSDAERAQREQAERTQTEHAQAEHEQTERASAEREPVQRTEEQRAPAERAPVEHAPAEREQVQHAAAPHPEPQHAAPAPQHAAPHPASDGGGHPGGGPNNNNNNNH